MQLITHLSLKGQCEAAFRFYEECLGGTITLMLRHGDSPMAADSPALNDTIVHATLKFGEQTLTGADVAEDQYVRLQGFALQLNIDDEDEAQRVFEALAEDGVVHLPLQKTFWAARYGMVTDRFGVPWEINCSQLMDTDKGNRRSFDFAQDDRV